MDELQVHLSSEGFPLLGTDKGNGKRWVLNRTQTQETMACRLAMLNLVMFSPSTLWHAACKTEMNWKMYQNCIKHIRHDWIHLGLVESTSCTYAKLKLIQATVGSIKANLLSKSNGSISLCLPPAAGCCGMLCWTAEQCFPSKPTGSCAKWDAAGSGCCGSRRSGGCFYAYTCLCGQGRGGGWGFWLAYSGSACFAIVCSVLGLVQRVASGFPPSGPHSRQREGQPALSGKRHGFLQRPQHSSVVGRWVSFCKVERDKEGACQSLPLSAI